MVLGQSVCPVNIDFELGSFQNWQCYKGTTAITGGVNTITVSPSLPTTNIHEIINKGTLVDPYGGFPISPPDGSNHAVKLGNDGTGAQAEQISYLINVPADQSNFVITYQYAVVLQDPGHLAAQQPRFTAKVFDITTNTYISCGSFDYVATAALPGFKKGTNQVVYKSWTPASINLYGYQGHQLRLEFTTADCTLGGHFGYAYVDVNNSCSALITGTDFCPSEPTLTLNGPAGFNLYNWYSADRSQLLGTGINLVMPAAGANGKTVQLDLIPFTGFGCSYTISTVIHSLPVITFNVTSPQPVCFPSTVSITDSIVTKNSDTNLTYTYWKDQATSIPLLLPAAIATSGTYYIKATAPTGCIDIKPVNVVINQLPTLAITNPLIACPNETVDITNAAVTAGSSAGSTFSYWTDTTATQAITLPAAIKTAGTYYIKATNASGCSVIKPVNVTFYPAAIFAINAPPAICFPGIIDITATTVTAGSTPGQNYTYWTDSLATRPLTSPDKIQLSGTYYIKATTVNGCVQIKPVIVTIYPLPQLVINDPPVVCFPAKVDITAGSITSGSTNIAKFTYWLDSSASIALATPTAVSDSGMYYIKATSSFGCEVIKPVTVVIHKTPDFSVINPAKTYVPNTVDITKKELLNGTTTGLTFTYWNNISATDAVGNPKAISQTGTYYIMGTNIYGCSIIKPVAVTVSTVPLILVPKAFTPTQKENNRLYPFLIAIKLFKSFSVYNRWGTLIFQTNSAEPQNGWDGFYKGQIQFFDTITWYAEGYDYNGNQIIKSGNTVLLK